MIVGPQTRTGCRSIVQLHETPEGNLDLLLSDGGLRTLSEIEAIRDKYGGRARLFAILRDHFLCGWELVSGGDLGVLTAAPILSREIERDLDGTVVGIGRLYWYPHFPVLDEIEELRRHGWIEFRGM